MRDGRKGFETRGGGGRVLRNEREWNGMENGGEREGVELHSAAGEEKMGVLIWMALMRKWGFFSSM